MPDKQQSRQTGTARKKAKPSTGKATGSRKRTGETSKEKYNQILNGLELKQVLVEKELIERDVDQPPRKTSVHIQRNNEAQIADDKQSFRVRDMLHIEGSNEGSDNSLFTIDLTLMLQYQSKKLVTKSFLKQFVNNNLDLHSWPYFRELVQSATNKMNLPPLVLPLSLK